MGEIDVRRGDQPDVQGHGFARPQAHDLTFLQNAQEFHLQCQRHVADLIEKQSAVVGRLEPARLGLRCPCEGAGLVAEELRLGQRFRQRSAVHRDERPRAAALLMDTAGGELFARPGLTGDQNRYIAASQLPEPSQYGAGVRIREYRRCGFHGRGARLRARRRVCRQCCGIHVAPLRPVAIGAGRRQYRVSPQNEQHD